MTGDGISFSQMTWKTTILHQFRVGFIWQLASDLQIESNIGYGWKNGKGDRDDQTILSLIEIEKITGNLTANIRWETGFAEDFFAVRDAGFIKFRRVSTTIAYSYQEKLECGVLGSFGYYDYSDDRDIFGAVIRRQTVRMTDTVARTFLPTTSFKIMVFLVIYPWNLSSIIRERFKSYDDYYTNRRYQGRIIATF